MRVADVLAETLAEAGTEVIFALSGNQIMPIFDACLDRPIRLVHTRHEAAAGFMAEGYAQISGKVGVALVTAGAGLGNAISPLLTARASQTPLLLISGDSPVGMDGKGTFQEMDQVALTRSATKWSHRVRSADNLAEDVRTALRMAMSGQPGPVHLSVPVDILGADIAAPTSGFVPAGEPEPDVSDLIAALASAERPLVLLGPDMNATRCELSVSELGVPVISMESPRGANDPSLGRIGEAWKQADLVIVLGKPVDFSLRFGGVVLWPQARWITVHGDAGEVARAERNLGERLVSARLGTPRSVLAALHARQSEVTDRQDWCSEVAGYCAARPALDGSGLSSPEVCLAVNALVGRATAPIFVSDGGEVGQWAQALVRAPRRIVNGVSGAIGGGIGYAMGAKAASPGSDVILMMGDGTAGFHLTEFETAVREGLSFVAVIGNDRRWNAEYEIQRRSFGEDRMHSCELSGARYDQAVEALGGFGAYVTRPEDLADALSAALASGKPACVNVMMEGRPAPSFG